MPEEVELSSGLDPIAATYVFYISVPRAVLTQNAHDLMRFNTAPTQLDQLRVLVEILEKKERQCFN